MRAETKLELPKLRGGLTVLPTAIRWAGTYLGCQQGPRPERREKPHGARAKPIGPGRDVRAETKLELPKLRGGLPKLGTGIRSAGTYLTLQQRFSPEWTVNARGLRGKHIGPGRDVRAETKLELPKLQGGLPKLGTGIRWAGTYLTPQQRFSPAWTVTARGLRGKPIGPGRAVRAEPKFELPKLQGSLPKLPVGTGIRWAGTQ